MKASLIIFFAVRESKDRLKSVRRVLIGVRFVKMTKQTLAYKEKLCYIVNNTYFRFEGTGVRKIYKRGVLV